MLTGESRDVEAPPERPWTHRVFRRPLPASVIVLALYVVLSFLNSTGGSLGTDTGAKVATLEEMAADDTLRPDVGYWAEEWDPDGTFHPLYQSVRNERGEWVSVTTLPMLVAAIPLYELGGYRLALLLPMLGALLAAHACRDVARQLGDERAGWTAFWITAVASPITVYALDLWEHSLGAGLMVAAFAALLRVFQGRGPVWLALVAGLLFGASATMRTETFVVAFVSVGVICLALLGRRALIRAVTVGGLSLMGFAGPWFANALLETDLGGSSRAERVSGASQREWWTELSVRGKEALITWFGLPGAGYPGGVVLGVVFVASIAGAALMYRRDEPRLARMVLAVGAACVLVSLLGGLAFVPGALIATPVAASAVLLRRVDTARAVTVVVAVIATVLTWVFQYTGGAGPQWGGRYLLAPTLLLVAVGVVALQHRPDELRRAVIGVGVVVTVFGLAWLQHRSHEVDDFFDRLEERPEDVVISTNGFLVREAMADTDERLYLSLSRGAEVAEAAEVVEEAGLDSYGVLTRSEEVEGPGTLVSSDRVSFLGVPLWYHSYRLASAATP